jgi:hypothetical protein
MSTANKTTSGELVRETNRRTFLSYLGAAPTLTAFAGAGLLSTASVLADTGPLNASQRRHRAFANFSPPITPRSSPVLTCCSMARSRQRSSLVGGPHATTDSTRHARLVHSFCDRPSPQPYARPLIHLSRPLITA